MRRDPAVPVTRVPKFAVASKTLFMYKLATPPTYVTTT